MKKKTYIGWTQPPHDTASDNTVLVITQNVGDVTGKVRDYAARPLPLHLEIQNHSPTGFSWGYDGSGPAQLALAILADATGDRDLAQRLHQKFKRMVVSRWPQGGMWNIEADEVLRLVGEYAKMGEPA